MCKEKTPFRGMSLSSLLKHFFNSAQIFFFVTHKVMITTRQKTPVMTTAMISVCLSAASRKKK